MDSGEFRKRGKDMVDYIADYMENLSIRKVTAQVEPGYLQNILPGKAPCKGESWDTIMADVEKAIMPGVSQNHFLFFFSFFLNNFTANKKIKTIKPKELRTVKE